VPNDDDEDDDDDDDEGPKRRFLSGAKCFLLRKMFPNIQAVLQEDVSVIFCFVLEKLM
jgi:hypothetical protein